MNLEKSKKRIAKKVKMGFQGYPKIVIQYIGETAAYAAGVSISYVEESGADAQEETFSSKIDARENDVIQSAIVKMIERSGAKTVEQGEGVLVSV